MKTASDVKVYKWPHKESPTPESVKREMEKFGFGVYDLQTIPGWFERCAHAHDYDEIRGVTAGNTTFHFQGLPPLTLEPGDIITTGTPPGVGLGMKPPLYLKKGDVMTLGIEGLGEQRQVVVPFKL